jgi:hypothetical protein
MSWNLLSMKTSMTSRGLPGGCGRLFPVLNGRIKHADRRTIIGRLATVV